MEFIIHIKTLILLGPARFCLSLLFISFAFFRCNGQEAPTLQISNIDFRLVEDNVIINYDITDSVPDGRYYIEMEVFNAEGKVIRCNYNDKTR